MSTSNTDVAYFPLIPLKQHPVQPGCKYLLVQKAWRDTSDAGVVFLRLILDSGN